MKKVILATRKSPLAVIQAGIAAAAIESQYDDCSVKLLKLTTTGDKQSGWSLEQHGGKGLFTKELEDAILKGRADLAVHSAKDLPTVLPDRLAIVAFLAREPANDVLILHENVVQPRCLATSSPRRREQLKCLYPGCKFVDIRGNVDTRLKKIAEKKDGVDGTVLALAGLRRLGVESYPDLRFKILDFSQMIPAAGQGAIALEGKSESTAQWVGINDAETQYAVTVERLLLDALGGGCQTAYGVHYYKNFLYIFHPSRGICKLAFESDLDYNSILKKISEIIKSF